MTQDTMHAGNKYPQRAGIGALIGVGFGALWGYTGVSRLPASDVWIGDVTVTAITVVLLFACVRDIHKTRRSPSVPDRTASRRRWRGFMFVLIGEIIALNLIANLLFAHELPQYLMPGIALVVGLHFFPLARVFRMSLFTATAALMTLAALLGIVALASGFDANLANIGVDMACAIILWGTAARTLQF